MVIQQKSMPNGFGNSIYFQLSTKNIYDSTLAVDILSYITLSDSNVLGG